MNTFVSFISTLLQSRTQAHIYHLQTDSYAAHVALQAYYEGIVPLIDGLVESYQGRYGKLEGYKMALDIKEYTDMSFVITYFAGLAVYVEQNRKQFPQDSYIQNQVDEVIALISSTSYKLRMLS